MITIQAHGIPPLAPDVSGVCFSPAQERLLMEERPIRICGAPTGAGKTYAFLQAARRGGRILFIVPTQALAHDIEMGARADGVRVYRWDGTQSQEMRRCGLIPWQERKLQWEEIISDGGMVVTTPETLSVILLGGPQRQRIPLEASDLLQAHHVVFDEAHTLGVRALGFLHFWAVLATHWHHRCPGQGFKLSLLSATHSNLFEALWKAAPDESALLPPETVACFDEVIENGARDEWRMLHGDVTVEIGAGDILHCLDDQRVTDRVRLGERLLLLYDSLRALTDQEWELRTRLEDLGVAPEACFLVNGQDRKAGGCSLGGTGFEAGLYPEDRHQVVIATSCIEAGVNLKGLRYAIIDPGLDAASLLQRIGRVARGNLTGQVWVTRPEKQRQHWLRLAQLDGLFAINDLRERLEPLRELPLEHARRLGGAYWSMLKREQPSLYQGLYRAHEHLSEAKAPSALLNAVHATLAKVSSRCKRHGEQWLRGVDETLRELRNFAPEVTIQFADYPPIQYSRDWAAAWLDSPFVVIEDDREIWRYPGNRSQSLRRKPKHVEIQLLCPSGDRYADTLDPYPNAWLEIKRRYLVFCRREGRRFSNPADRDFIEKANSFIEATGIMVRETPIDNPII